MRRISAELPYPVSVNSMYRAYRGRVILSSEYRAWTKACSVIAIAALANGFDGVYAGFGSQRVQVGIKMVAPDRRQRDIDNIVKGIFDTMQKANWVKNDSQIDYLTLERMQISRTDPRVVVWMEQRAYS